MKRFGIVVLLTTVMACAVAAADNSADLLRRARANFEQVRDYTADVLLSVDGPGIQVRNMKYKIYFRQPDNLRIKAKEGFALLPKDSMVFGNPVREITSNYHLTNSGRARVGGRDAYVLKATPKSDAASPPMTLWVDTQRGLIVQSETRLPTGQIGRAGISYVRVDGKYWMPSRVTTEAAGPKQAPVQEREARRRGHRLPDTDGKLTLEFRNYRVNRGIADDVFKQAQPVSPDGHSRRKN